jgi:hypothetical protein
VLATSKHGADKWVVAIVPGRLDHDTPQMRVAGFRDAALCAFRAARVLGRDEANAGRRARGSGKATGIAEFGRDRQGSQIVDATEAPEAVDTTLERLEREQRAQDGFDVRKTSHDLVDGTEIGAVCLIECADRPDLRPEPRVVTVRPYFLAVNRRPCRSRNLDDRCRARSKSVRISSRQATSRGRLLPVRSECESSSTRRPGRGPRAGRHRADRS